MSQSSLQGLPSISGTSGSNALSIKLYPEDKSEVHSTKQRKHQTLDEKFSHALNALLNDEDDERDPYHKHSSVGLLGGGHSSLENAENNSNDNSANKSKSENILQELKDSYEDEFRYDCINNWLKESNHPQLIAIYVLPGAISGEHALKL